MGDSQVQDPGIKEENEIPAPGSCFSLGLRNCSEHPETDAVLSSAAGEALASTPEPGTRNSKS